MSRRAGQKPPQTFTCWVPGCPSYGRPQPIQGETYEPGSHYRRRHMNGGQGAPGTPVVEWEKATGRSLFDG